MIRAKSQKNIIDFVHRKMYLLQYYVVPMHTSNSLRILIYYYANAIEYLFVYYVLWPLGLTRDI